MQYLGVNSQRTAGQATSRSSQRGSLLRFSSRLHEATSRPHFGALNDPALLASSFAVLIWQGAHHRVGGKVPPQTTRLSLHPMSRLYETFALTLALVGGTEEQKRAALREIDKRHRQYDKLFHDGERVSQNPKAMMIVRATTIQGFLVAGHLFGNLRTEADLERAYNQLSPAFDALQFPASRVAPGNHMTWPQHRRYVQGLVAEMASDDYAPAEFFEGLAAPVHQFFNNLPASLRDHMLDVMSMCLPPPLVQKLGGREVSPAMQRRRIAEVRSARFALRYSGLYGYFLNHTAERGFHNDVGEWQWPETGSTATTLDGLFLGERPAGQSLVRSLGLIGSGAAAPVSVASL